MPEKKNLPKTNDHKAPAVKQEKSTEKTVTVSGVEVTVDTSLLDDWDITELIADIQFGPSSEQLKTVFLIRKILGSQYEQVKNRLRKANGGVIKNEMFGEFVQELFKELAPNS